MRVADRDGSVADRVAEVLGEGRRDDPAGGGDVGDAVEGLGERAQEARAAGSWSESVRITPSRTSMS